MKGFITEAGAGAEQAKKLFRQWLKASLDAGEFDFALRAYVELRQELPPSAPMFDAEFARALADVARLRRRRDLRRRVRQAAGLPPSHGGFEAARPPSRFSSCPRSHGSAVSRSKRRRALFDHLIRRPQQRRRDGEAEGLGRLDVDSEIKPSGALNRYVTRPSTLSSPKSLTRY
jgi:hypothetical protein